MDGRTRTLLEEVSTGNPIADRKIQMALEGLPANTQKQLVNEFSAYNRLLLAEFLNNFVAFENIAPGTKRVYVCNLLYLCRFRASKPFKQVTRDDILTYLQGLRRPLNSDPFQKWINTHNNRAVIYQKFFKWLYYQELSAKERMTPDVVKDLPILKRKEKTHVQAKDLWTPQDDAAFLKYVDDPRLQFYHTGSIDTSARPHEFLSRRIGDVKIKMAGNRAYAELEIDRGGKTKSRTVPLIMSLPYYKALLASAWAGVIAVTNMALGGLVDGVNSAVSAVVEAVNAIIKAINGAAEWTGVKIPTVNFSPATYSPIPIVAAATGFNDVVTRPTMFLTGEVGAEHVMIMPSASSVSSPHNSFNSGGVTFIQVLYGSLLRDRDAYHMMAGYQNRELARRNFRTPV